MHRNDAGKQLCLWGELRERLTISMDVFASASQFHVSYRKKFLGGGVGYQEWPAEDIFSSWVEVL